MKKTVKFTISFPAAEFREIETKRRKAGQSRSRFIRDALLAGRAGEIKPGSMNEGRPPHQAEPAPNIAGATDIEERRRRAIAAAGRFHSGVVDLSSDHDRYLAEDYAEAPAEKGGSRRRSK